MLFAQEHGNNGIDPATWAAIGSLGTVIIGAVAAAVIKVTGAWSSTQRTKDRDAIADYQKLLDAAEAARDRYEAARDKTAADLMATLTENLRLKSMVADKDAEIAELKKHIAEKK